jgi:hypothetical protein
MKVLRLKFRKSAPAKAPEPQAKAATEPLTPAQRKALEAALSVLEGTDRMDDAFRALGGRTIVSWDESGTPLFGVTDALNSKAPATEVEILEEGDGPILGFQLTGKTLVLATAALQGITIEELVTKAAWKEDDHARDKYGRFTRGGSTETARSDKDKEGYPTSTPSEVARALADSALGKQLPHMRFFRDEDKMIYGDHRTPATHQYASRKDTVTLARSLGLPTSYVYDGGYINFDAAREQTVAEVDTLRESILKLGFKPKTWALDTSSAHLSQRFEDKLGNNLLLAVQAGFGDDVNMELMVLQKLTEKQRQALDDGFKAAWRGEDHPRGRGGRFISHGDGGGEDEDEDVVRQSLIRGLSSTAERMADVAFATPSFKDEKARRVLAAARRLLSYYGITKSEYSNNEEGFYTAMDMLSSEIKQDYRSGRGEADLRKVEAMMLELQRAAGPDFRRRTSSKAPGKYDESKHRRARGRFAPKPKDVNDEPKKPVNHVDPNRAARAWVDENMDKEQRLIVHSLLSTGRAEWNADKEGGQVSLIADDDGKKLLTVFLEEEDAAWSDRFERMVEAGSVNVGRGDSEDSDEDMGEDMDEDEEDVDVQGEKASQLVEDAIEDGDLDADSSYDEIVSFLTDQGYSAEVAEFVAEDLGREVPESTPKEDESFNTGASSAKDGDYEVGDIVKGPDGFLHLVVGFNKDGSFALAKDRSGNVHSYHNSDLTKPKDSDGDEEEDDEDDMLDSSGFSDKDKQAVKRMDKVKDELAKQHLTEAKVDKARNALERVVRSRTGGKLPTDAAALRDIIVDEDFLSESVVEDYVTGLIDAASDDGKDGMLDPDHEEIAKDYAVAHLADAILASLKRKKGGKSSTNQQVRMVDHLRGIVDQVYTLLRDVDTESGGFTKATTVAASIFEKLFPGKRPYVYSSSMGCEVAKPTPEGGTDPVPNAFDYLSGIRETLYSAGSLADRGKLGAADFAKLKSIRDELVSLQNELCGGMATGTKAPKKPSGDGRWVTARGRRVFIKDGETLQEALAAKPPTLANHSSTVSGYGVQNSRDTQLKDVRSAGTTLEGLINLDKSSPPSSDKDKDNYAAWLSNIVHSYVEETPEGGDPAKHLQTLTTWLKAEEKRAAKREITRKEQRKLKDLKGELGAVSKWLRRIRKK